MKNFFLLTLIVSSVVFLSACSQAPLTEEDQASKYGMTLQEFREMKEAAARMNMNMEDHMKMMGH